MANGQGFSMVVGSGSVSPSTFVTPMTGQPSGVSNVIAGYYCQQCTVSTVPIIGIAQEGSRYAPTDETLAAGNNTTAGQYTGVAGYTGDPLKIYALGDICLLAIGTAVTPGQYLMSNATGQGIPATGASQIGALSLEGGVANDLIRVQVVIGVN